MKKLIFLLLIICISITGCIELTEQIHFNKDGSGTANIGVKVWGTINENELASVSKQDLAAMDGMLHYDIKTLKEKAEGIKNIPGISKVEYTIKASFDPNRNDVSTIFFHFDSVTTLNKALIALYNAHNLKENETSDIIQKELNKEILRTFTSFFYLWDAHLSNFTELYDKKTDGDYYNRKPYSDIKLNYNYSFEYPIETSKLNTIDSTSNNFKEVKWQVDALILSNSPLQISNSFIPKK